MPWHTIDHKELNAKQNQKEIKAKTKIPNKQTKIKYKKRAKQDKIKPLLAIYLNIKVLHSELFEDTKALLIN